MLTATYYLHTKWICDYKLQLNKQHWWRELMTITMDQQMTSTLATTMHFYWHFVNCRVGLLALVVSKVKAVPHLHTVTEISDTNLLSLPYKVLTTTQPSYLRNLISLQPPRSTRSSSVVTLSRPPTISSLKITDRSFSYASPRLRNQLPDSFRQPQYSRLDSPPHPLLNSSLTSSTLSSSITPSLFHSRHKTYLFNKSFPP